MTLPCVGLSSLYHRHCTLQYRVSWVAPPTAYPPPPSLWCSSYWQTDLLDTVREERDRNRTVTSKLTETEFVLASVRSDLEAANNALAAREERLRALNTEVRV